MSKDDTVSAGPSASPEATGGRGTTLEHRYGGSLLAALITHTPVSGLGSGLVPVRVGFQQDAPVDDFMVYAESDGAAVTWHVAARRRPVLGSSDDKTVALFASFLGLAAGAIAEMEAGSVLLGLVVKGPYGPAEQLATLCEVASTQVSADTFRAAIARRSAPLQRRLQNVDDIIKAAGERLGWGSDRLAERDWPWTILRSTRVVQTMLDEDQQDAVEITNRLAVLLENDTGRANALRQALNSLSADFAGTGALVSEADVRRHLVGRVALAAAGDLASALAWLTANERSLRLSTPRVLRGVVEGATVELAVDRPESLTNLLEAMQHAGRHGVTVLVRGEPSVGKSVLALQAVDDLRRRGGAIAVLGLRGELNLDTGLQRLFSGFPVGPTRLLVLDGAEVVQEGHTERFLVLVNAALDAGVGVVAVCRDDASRAAMAALTEVASVTPAEVVVEPVSDIEHMIDTFPVLDRLQERRSRWLLQRLGLVDLILRAGSALQPTDEVMSEAAVFAAVWLGWVRGDGGLRGGASPSPDAREEAMLGAARRALGLTTHIGSSDTLGSLRSDGLLEPYDPFDPEPRFTSDIVRDFATVHLLLRAGDQVLAEAGAPRWALRAAQVSCQAQLLRRGAEALQSQLEFYDTLGRDHGQRWSDTPWEAILRCGRTTELLGESSGMLLADDGARLHGLFRVTNQHFSRGHELDPVLTEPVMTWLLDHRSNVPARLREQADELLVRWLRGAARDEATAADDVARTIRRRIRDDLLRRWSEYPDDSFIEALALLGSDSDDRARKALRDLATERPWDLMPVVERPDPTWILARHDLTLLAELTLAYYIDKRPDEWGMRFLNDGIRRHEPGGFMDPRATWFYGPFWALLMADLRVGLDVAGLILRHAAETRVTRDGSRAAEEFDGLTARFLDEAERKYVGDASVYGWYRGASMGPDACTSLLLACERMLDQLAALGVPLRRVAKFILEGASDLATVGLVVGFLLRHVDQVVDELDDFLAVPELWHLELARVSTELSGLAMHDAEDVAGRDRRMLSFRDVAPLLAIQAKANPDGSQAERLSSIRARLAAGAPAATPEETIDVRRWCSLLDPECFAQSEVEGQVAFEYVEPADIAHDLAETRQNIDRVTELYRLSNRYHLVLEPPFHAAPHVGWEEIVADLPKARALAAGAMFEDPQLPDALAALAGATIRAVAEGAPIPADDVEWSVEVCLEALTPEAPGPYDSESAMNTLASDRSAAAALPYLLLPSRACGEPGVVQPDELPAVITALTAATTHLTHEVRRITTRTLRQVWNGPCGTLAGACRHEHGWTAVEQGARAVSMSAPDQHGRRQFSLLNGDDPATALRAAAAEDLVLQRLGSALASTIYASSAKCLTDRAAHLRDALLEAYGRTALHYAAARYEVRAEDHTLVADALLGDADATPERLIGLLHQLGTPSEAGTKLLGGLCTAATYDADRRRELRAQWSDLMRAVLPTARPATSGRRRRRGRAIAALIPAPQPLVWDANLDDRLRSAREGWPTAGDLATEIEEWLPLAAGEPAAMGRLARLMLVSPVEQQVSLGLPWICDLVVPNASALGTETLVLEDWLTGLRDSEALADRSRTEYDLIVDALAAANVGWAQVLQRRDV